MLNLKSKPDAEEALNRMEQWWLGRNTDRPLLTIPVSSPRPERRVHDSERSRWLDFEGRIVDAAFAADHGVYLAETFPTFEPNLGPDMLSTLFGLDLQFASDTSWGAPVAAALAEVLGIEPDFEAPLWKEVMRLQEMGLEAGDGRWITLFTDLHPNADVLAALLGPQTLCLEFADDLDLARRAVEHVTPACIEAFRRQAEPILARGLPVGTWMRAFSMKPSYVAQCDFSAMVSPAMFEEAVLPSIQAEMRAADRVIYHLDGPDALRHLDLILALPGLNAVQWVYGAGQGPARRWRDVYRRILEAGASIRIEAEDPQDIVDLHREFGAAGVWHHACFALPEGEARQLLDSLL